eukprot:NODE_132_length_16614_cov_0.935392.p5 type:complete len:389 gc:universal NODE_132_length_16614_cov_0.935392:12106-10940(-)
MIAESEIKLNRGPSKSNVELYHGFSEDFEDNQWDTPTMQWRKFVFRTLTDQYANQSARYLNKFFQILVVVNLFSYAMETMYDFMDSPWKRAIWQSLDVLAAVIFSLEYFGKILSCPNYHLLPRFMASPSWMIDLITLLPFYIQFFFDYTNSSYLGILRLTRILRLYRFFKLSLAPRQSQIFVIAFLRSKDALSMLAFVIMIFMLVFSTFIYYAEMTIEEPEGHFWMYTSGNFKGQKSPFQNIIDSMWFVLETMSTVGYGDVVPSSILGKFISGLMALSGLFMFAFPISILGIRMAEVYSEFVKKDNANRHLTEMVVPEHKRVYWDCQDLSTEQQDLVKWMLEDLFETEDTVKKYSKTLKHVVNEMKYLRLCLASFGGAHLEEYSKIKF